MQAEGRNVCHGYRLKAEMDGEGKGLRGEEDGTWSQGSEGT